MIALAEPGLVGPDAVSVVVSRKTRQRLPGEVHAELFQWVVPALHEHGLKTAPDAWHRRSGIGRINVSRNKQCMRIDVACEASAANAYAKSAVS